jgi:hypothetical protein
MVPMEAGRDLIDILISDEFKAASKLSYIRPCMSIRGYTSTLALAGMCQLGHGVHEAAISIEGYFRQFESDIPNNSPGTFIRCLHIFDEEECN